MPRHLAGQAGRGTAPRAPVVLPLAPREGWARASGAHRALAVACPALLAVWLVLGQLPAGGVRALGAAAPPRASAYLLVGPAACYALARVLRPHPPGQHLERVLRHTCAAVATAHGSALLLLLIGPGNDAAVRTALLMACTASVLGPVTLVWGALAAAVRAGTLPAEPAHPPGGAPRLPV